MPSPGDTSESEALGTRLERIILGGLGGIMPFVASIGSGWLVSKSAREPLETYDILGLSIFFIIGASFSYAFASPGKKEAFITGIVAPALIANILVGLSHPADDYLTRNPIIPGKSVVEEIPDGRSTVDDLADLRELESRIILPR